MIEKAAALAEARGWEHEILSPMHLAVAIPSPRWRFINSVEIYCPSDGGAWGFVMLKELSIMCERNEEVDFAVRRLRQFFTPAKFDILPEPDCYIRYAWELNIDEGVENHLGRAIDEALAHIDRAWTVFLLVNWGKKSGDDAIAYANVSGA